MCEVKSNPLNNIFITKDALFSLSHQLGLISHSMLYPRGVANNNPQRELLMNGVTKRSKN